MSDDIPSATADPDATERHHPTNAEDRKAAAALSSLHTNDIGADSGAKLSSTGDQEALGKAMSRLEIAAGLDTKVKKTAGPKEAVKKKVVKVSAEDVNLLVEELDLNKIKATELLKAYDGDTRKAIRAFIAPSVVG